MNNDAKHVDAHMDAHAEDRDERAWQVCFTLLGDGSDYETVVHAVDARAAYEKARDEVEEWILDGDWWDEDGTGAVVEWCYNVYASRDDGGFEDEPALKDFDWWRLAPDEKRAARFYGLPDTCEHSWMPVASYSTIGGTRMLFVSHCAHCGWIKQERHCGPAEGPNEVDRLEFLPPRDAAHQNG